MEQPPGCSIIFCRKGGKPTPDKLTSITELAHDTLTGVTDGYEPWAAFINTMSRNYKYSFADQVLIHAQRPDASACADYDVWTRRMGRYVRRGAKGIALLDTSGDAPRLRYVFDVSDTGARRNSRPFEPWQVNSENTNVVASMLEQHFGVEPRVSLAEQLEVVAAQLADEYWLDNNGDILGIVDGSFLEGVR